MAKRTKRLTSLGEDMGEVRINKFLSEAGVCSRREADSYIEKGKVLIDGVTAQIGSKVVKDSLVTFCGKPVRKEEKLVLIAFNKPVGIVCTTDRREPDNIIDYINYGMRIYPIGRLDKDSEGLILLTNDGNIVNRILRAENRHEKEYIVSVNKEINPEFVKNMSTGVPVLDSVTNPCTVTQIDKYTFNIILTQGLNRQIRRMCEGLGYKVVSLRRIRIMNIQLGRLKVGGFRNVTEKEIEELNKAFQMMETSGRTIVAAERNPEQFESVSRQKISSVSSGNQTRPEGTRRPGKANKSNRDQKYGKQEYGKQEYKSKTGRHQDKVIREDRASGNRKIENRKQDDGRKDDGRLESKSKTGRHQDNVIREDRASGNRKQSRYHRSKN